MDPEILVHVAAPSASSDDARYRAQVAAILHFQSVSRQPVWLGFDSDSPDERDDRRRHDENLHSSTEVISVPCSLLSQPQKARSSGPSECRSAVSPSIGQSGRVTQPQANLSDASIQDGRLSDPGDAVKNRRESLESLISVIPDSQPEILTESDSATRPGQSDLPAVKRRRIQPSSPAQLLDGTIAPPRASSPAFKQSTGNQSAGQCHNGAPTQPLADRATYTNLTTLPLEIHPPPPPISNTHFTTHITATLSMLAERLKPSRTYKPVLQARDLEKLERGHWVVHINILDPPREQRQQRQQQQQQAPRPARDSSPHPHDWDAAFFHRFWTFLSEFVARDARAGWGVWCILEKAEEDAHPTLLSGGDVTSDLSTTPVSLRVYAWGEVAVHVYLLLFLASERRIRGMGAQWRDARGEVVIELP
ncbi:hypothetical protein N7474_004446 [Penicillium riverlandense]|uniref:uncharacterized protein n=1 Tax=Penicillium riverlandense TaxID=1903569 RepID=UPI0025483942|nr:uncharacterized protein N7474_004446 [Penicillium riverlandense]KAJ5818855.1 hypothetical protein N7474_004446 [Penicillium riverlandense]